jgi:hypothetical protein
MPDNWTKRSPGCIILSVGTDEEVFGQAVGLDSARHSISFQFGHLATRLRPEPEAVEVFFVWQRASY